MRTWRHIAAALVAVAVLVILFGVFRMRSWMPLALAGFAWAAFLIATIERRRPAPGSVELPAEVSRRDFEHAMTELDAAATRLRGLAAEAPAPDLPLFERMAELIVAIREHHRASPSHLTLTRRFLRHTLGRMVDAVGGYVDLARRSGPDHRDRLRAVSHQMEGFVTVLERIDRACVENDLTALEINVEVLGEQLDRRR